MSLFKISAGRYNVGHIDLLIRILIGIAMMALADLSWIGSWGWIGLLPALTGVFRYCPLYALLGFNTYRSAPYVG